MHFFKSNIYQILYFYFYEKIPKFQGRIQARRTASRPSMKRAMAKKACSLDGSTIFNFYLVISKNSESFTNILSIYYITN